MADILDVVHRFSYQVDDAQLQAVLGPINQQISRIDVLTSRVKQLEQALSKTAASDIERRNRIINLINQQNAAIEATATAVGAEVVQNEKLQQAISSQIGTINQLNAQLKLLTQLRDRSTNVQEQLRYNAQIEATRQRLQQMYLTAQAGAQRASGPVFAFNQVLREGPAFAFSFQTGILAISNNLPILVDEFNRARAAGQSTGKILADIGKGLFSFTSILTIGITALTLFGDKLFSVSEAAKAAKKAQDELTDSINDTFAAANQQIDSQQRNAGILLRLATDQNVSRDKQAIAIKKLRDQFGGLLQDYTDEQIRAGLATDALNKNINAREKSTAAANSANKLQGAIDKNEQERLKLLSQQNSARADLNRLNEEAAPIEERLAKARKSGLSSTPGGGGPELLRINNARQQVQNDLKRIDASLRVVEQQSGNLKAARDGFSKAAEELAVQAQDLILEPEKTKDGRENNLAFQLRQQIEELEKAQRELRNRNVVETESIIKQRIEAERAGALEEINIQVDKARKEKQLNAETVALFGRIRAITNENFNLQIEKQTEEFYKRQKKAQEDFLNDVRRSAISDLTERLKIEEDTAADSYNTRIQLARATTAQELAENSKRYDEELEQARQLGNDEEAVYQDFKERERLIVEKGNRAILAAEDAYLKYRLQLLQEATTAEINEVQDHANAIIQYFQEGYDGDLTSYRQYRKEKARAQYDADREALRIQKDSAQKAFQEARAAELRVIFDPNSTAKDRADARSRTQAAQTAFTEAQNRFLSTAVQGNRLYESIFGDTARIADPEERRREEIQKSIAAYQNLAQSAVAAFQMIYDAQIRTLEAEISVRERRVDVALKLAEKGNAEALRLEQERLNGALKAREDYARREAIINSALAVSNAIVAVAEAASQSGAGAIAVVPAVIAAIIAGYAAISSATTESSGVQFWKGGYTGDGGKYEPAGIVHKGEFVLSQADIARVGGIEAVEQFRAGQLSAPMVAQMPQLLPANSNGYATKADLNDLGGKLDEVTEAVRGIKIHAVNRLDGRGVTQMIETTQQIDRARRSRM